MTFEVATLNKYQSITIIIKKITVFFPSDNTKCLDKSKSHNQSGFYIKFALLMYQNKVNQTFIINFTVLNSYLKLH